MSNETTSALAEMGVNNADQIIGYTLVQTNPDTDVIRINYKRPRNSILARRRTYEFKRMGKPKRGISEPNEDRIRYEISPILRRAIAELDELLAQKNSKKASKMQIQREIEDLRLEMNTRLAHLGSLLQELDVA